MKFGKGSHGPVAALKGNKNAAGPHKGGGLLHSGVNRLKTDGIGSHHMAHAKAGLKIGATAATGVGLYAGGIMALQAAGDAITPALQSTSASLHSFNADVAKTSKQIDAVSAAGGKAADSWNKLLNSK